MRKNGKTDIGNYMKLDFTEDKILIAKLLERGMHNKAKEHLNLIHQITEPHDTNINDQVLGMLFILDVLYPSKRSK